MTSHRLLLIALLAMTVLYGLWLGPRAGWPLLVVFAAPPLALAALHAARPRAAAFWAGVLALLWFSHGVMMAWSEPTQRPFALAEILLALAVVYAASIDGIRARFGNTRAGKPG